MKTVTGFLKPSYQKQEMWNENTEHVHNPIQYSYKNDQILTDIYNHESESVKFKRTVRTETEDTSSVAIIHHLRLCNLIKRGFLSSLMRLKYNKKIKKYSDA